MVCAQLVGYPIHAFWLCLGGVLLIYTHRPLLTAAVTFVVYTGLGIRVGGPTSYVVVWVYGAVEASILVVGFAVVCYFTVCICFMTVCCNYFNFVFYTVVATYYFSCASVMTALPGYILVGLAIVCVFGSCFVAFRAFSIATCRARMSSALSIIRSSSGVVIVVGTALLEDGISFCKFVFLGSVVSVYPICFYNAATFTCNYRTVVTIFVVLAVPGASSSYSTHLILLRRFSILYAYFCSVGTGSSSLPVVLPYC
jgi:hypothetical protein